MTVSELLARAIELYQAADPENPLMDALGCLQLAGQDQGPLVCIALEMLDGMVPMVPVTRRDGTKTEARLDTFFTWSVGAEDSGDQDWTNPNLVHTHKRTKAEILGLMSRAARRAQRSVA